jgi:hypothetical protein
LVAPAGFEEPLLLELLLELLLLLWAPLDEPLGSFGFCEDDVPDEPPPEGLPDEEAHAASARASVTTKRDEARKSIMKDLRVEDARAFATRVPRATPCQSRERRSRAAHPAPRRRKSAPIRR